uniref:G-protein coupled receptors family 1 profile domain-containing protein n=2 Tax=Poecilia mexicana TaxID=48701 RepID=A0A3B3Y8Y3_9TELE
MKVCWSGLKARPVRIHSVSLPMDESNFTGFSSNSSSTGLPQDSWNQRGLFPAVVLTFCYLLGVPGNIAVIIFKPNWEHLSRTTQSLMMSLTISDLMCLLTLPLWIYNLLLGWTFGIVACKVLSYVVYFTVYVSQMTVTALSIQRYIIVVREWKCDIPKSVLVFLLWLSAFTLCIYVLMTEQLTKEGQWIRCAPRYSSEAQLLAVLFTEILFGLASSSLVTLSYISLHKKVRSSAFFNNPQTSRLLISIILSNFIMFFPLHMVNMLAVLGIILKNKELLKFCADSWSVVKSFTMASSTVNPLLYAFISTKFCPFCTKNSSNTDERTPRNT